MMLLVNIATHVCRQLSKSAVVVVRLWVDGVVRRGEVGKGLGVF